MKKNTLFVFLAVALFACSKNDKIVKENDTYYVSVEGKQGDGTLKIVKFLISTNIIDSLKVPAKNIVQMCQQTVDFADFDAKFKPTYQLPESATLLFMKDDYEFVGSISGNCENAYGTRGDIDTYVKFGRDFNLAKDSTGRPEIMSF